VSWFPKAKYDLDPPGERKVALVAPDALAAIANRHGTFAAFVHRVREGYYAHGDDPALREMKPELYRNKRALDAFEAQVDAHRGWLGCVIDHVDLAAAAWRFSITPWIDAHGLPLEASHLISQSTVDAVKLARPCERPWAALGGVLRSAVTERWGTVSNIVEVTGCLAGAPPEDPAGTIELVGNVCGETLDYIDGRHGKIGIRTAVATIRRHSRRQYPW
jgi:hypothetical protein